MALWQGFSNIDFAVYAAIASNRLLYEVPFIICLLFNSYSLADYCFIRLFGKVGFCAVGFVCLDNVPDGLIFVMSGCCCVVAISCFYFSAAYLLIAIVYFDFAIACFYLADVNFVNAVVDFELYVTYFELTNDNFYFSGLVF